MMAQFTIVKNMMADDVVDYRRKVLEWLTARLGECVKHDNQHIFGETYTADTWSVESNSFIGKFHNWRMEYEIEINDDVVAVEFALIKDSL
jgi:hypothetical protein